MSHTPGPWGVIPAGSDQDDSRIIALVRDQEIANLGIYNDPSKEESKANARLIAAAPDLMDALLTVLESAHPDPTQHPTMTRAWEIGRKAIAKATTPQ